MEVRKEKVGFESLQKREIDFYIPAKNRSCIEEVILYINDENNRINETLLFKIVFKE